MFIRKLNLLLSALIDGFNSDKKKYVNFLEFHGFLNKCVIKFDLIFI